MYGLVVTGTRIALLRAAPDAIFLDHRAAAIPAIASHQRAVLEQAATASVVFPDKATYVARKAHSINPPVLIAIALPSTAAGVQKPILYVYCKTKAVECLRNSFR